MVGKSLAGVVRLPNGLTGLVLTKYLLTGMILQVGD